MTMTGRRGDARNLVDVLGRCSFPPPGTPVDCAFSGGADSTALLVLASAAGCEVTAIHVDHGLRPESAVEAERARSLAAALGVEFRLLTVNVALGPNLEARARAARLAALPPGALTGHTADDRAETMLINLLRGTGLDGLTAMSPSPTRPLLAVRREETRQLCADQGLTPVADPSNTDARFVRNRVRGELLPLMADISDRDVVPLLLRTADTVGDDLEWLESAAALIDPTDARQLATAPLALARRAVRRWLVEEGYPPDLATVRRVLAVAGGRRLACEIAGGRRVERHRQRLRVIAGSPIASVDGMGSSGGC
jgi:tRNA(Ile)-lysidine synthase